MAIAVHCCGVLSIIIICIIAKLGINLHLIVGFGVYWIFVELYCHTLCIYIAHFVAGLVVGLQVAIAVLGNFRSGRLEEYVNCFEESIGYGSGNELPANITFPVSFPECISDHV